MKPDIGCFVSPRFLFVFHQVAASLARGLKNLLNSKYLSDNRAPEKFRAEPNTELLSYLKAHLLAG